MRSTDVQNQVPQVSADQLKFDRTLKHLRKLRWIGREREAQRIFQTLGDIRLHSSRSIDWGQLNTSSSLICEETSRSDLASGPEIRPNVS
jgi:hypothetical protein